MLDAAVRSVNAARPDAVLVTGDLLDNAQANELALARTVLDGGRARPDSGAPGYDGRAGRRRPRPCLLPPRRRSAPPPRPAGAAQRPFYARRAARALVRRPGNHDLLVAGELARTPSTAAVAVGGERLVHPDAGLDVPRSEDALTPQLVDRALSGGLPGRTTRIAPDPGRRELTPDEAIAGLRAASGHGGTGARMDYAFDAGRIGARDRARHRAPRRRLRRRAGARADALAARPAGRRRGAPRRRRLPPAADQGPGRRGRAGAARRRRPRGGGARRRLAPQPHRAAKHARPAATGSCRPRRWPTIPSRRACCACARPPGGGTVLDTWMLDTAPDPLADTARELAYLDAQGGRPQHEAGTRLDRNVRLYLR